MFKLLLSSVVIAALALLVMPASVVGILFLTFIAIDILIYKELV